MLRECFAGRNKTLRALFASKSFSRRALLRTTGHVEEASVTSNTRSSLSPEQVQEMRGTLLSCLEDLQLHDARANAMPLDAFLRLHTLSTSRGVVWRGV